MTIHARWRPRRLILFPSFLLLLAMLWTACGSRSAQAKRKSPLMLATAANVQYAMEELRTAFTAKTGVATEMVISSSGKLTAQIVQGAPYDLFVSANMLYPRTLVDRGMALDSPRVYALGALVLWTARERALAGGLAGLSGPGIEKIAVANPRNAPYGEEALRALRRSGVLARVEGRLVFGESVAQTNQYILTGAVDAGITAKATVLSPDFREVGRWEEVPDSLYRPILQGAVITRHGGARDPEACRRFLAFLTSPEGRAILERYGYRLPPD